ncbi:phosphotransferase family protein [Pullulanibacillus pueri]|uniref:Aminoglycoside phosphotransferase domain-containing protein n=1 Tax=Pullulanibacillus pueri TaxID=1437324 RepID=A0A8J2ZUQ7_9BACL|nr:aminoglycoside phosphotransferase family protein [Pullulanibacillus pueri]GGH77851.1 hypothetical protein GCM10007096_10360 [Pullulanibacillus pueri]
MLDCELEKYLMKQYGAKKLVRLTGGFTNAVYLLEATEPPLVVKIAQWSNGDMENEANTLRFLNQGAFTPEVRDLFSMKQQQIIVFTYKEGKNGQAILDTGHFKSSIELFHDMGKLLATAIHSHPYSGEQQGLRVADFKRIRFDLNYVPETLMKQSKALLEERGAQEHPWTLTHGDFGSHNVLADGHHLTAIDWEWAEWGPPLVDLAWTCWNTKLHYPSIADQLNQTFLQAYQAERDVHYTPELMKVYSLYKLWIILNKVQSSDEETQQKWVKRLEWTLQTEII